MKYRILVIIFFMICSLLFSQNKSTHIYAVKNLDTLKLDVYTPKQIKNTDKLPVLLWMHGGGFSGGARNNVKETKLMEFISKKGYIGVSISYRLLLQGSETGFGCYCPKDVKLEIFKQAAIDYLDAAKFIFENSSDFQIDTDKIIAGGSSAGAESILNAVYLKSFFIKDHERYKDVRFAGVLSLAGALVNVDYITAGNMLPTALFHGTDDKLVPIGTAPHHYCNPNNPGYLVLDGSQTITEKLDALGSAYYFHKVIGGGHEQSSITLNQLNNVLKFFDKAVFNSEVIQTKKISRK